MTSAPSNDTDVYPLPSLPPSPTEEEDLSRAPHEGDDLSDTRWHAKQPKGKERDSGIDQPYTELGGSEESLERPDLDVYPPLHDDIKETRRVEENLRLWELAERQRRKVARGSAAGGGGASGLGGGGTPRPTSLVGDVTRRASLLWSSASRHDHPDQEHRRRRKSPYHASPDPSLGNHAALRSRESLEVAMDDIHDRPGSQPASGSASPATSMPDITVTSTDADADADVDADAQEEDPFANPPSPFEDGYSRRREGRGKSSAVAATADSQSLLKPPDKPRTPGPSLSSSSSSSPSSRQPRMVPPPQPLGLPPPRTPPPPLVDSVPPSTGGSQEQGGVGEVRWWHEWLCGCGEGADRGGDNQAGRTNPFE